MSRDHRLSDALHVLVHMSLKKRPTTSDVLAKVMRTNPVVIRRLMAGLREAEIVKSDKGHGGGWTLARDPARVTMLDIYNALGRPSLFAMANRSQVSGCLVEKAVNSRLSGALTSAEQALLAGFGEISLSILRDELSASVHYEHLLDVEVAHGGGT